MDPCYTRRDLLKRAGTATAIWLGNQAAATSGAAATRPAQTVLPRWRGFNLLNFFQALSRGERGNGLVPEDDLRWIRDWGFNFVRLPMDYWLWVDADWPTTHRLRPDDVFHIEESTLARIDRFVDRCGHYGLHLSLNFHRAPGYCINDPQREPFVLWRDRRAEDAFVYHWEIFAKRYRAIAPERISFNLVNEAPRPRSGYMTRDDYHRVMHRTTQAIRRYTPRRIVIIDGLNIGKEVVESMVADRVAQSVHGYTPAQISHYRAPWVDRGGHFPAPTWPIRNADGSIRIGRADLARLYAPWAAVARRGIGVHCGECGCYNKTPTGVFRAWFDDVMQILKGHGIGYALWNFRGGFGILDSGRTDVKYENWHGHLLDRGLLDLLQRY